MTGIVRSVLHEHADNTDAPAVDLDAIFLAGDRRIRRRRSGAGLAAPAVAAILAGSVLILPGITEGGRDDLTAGPSAPFAERKVSYAVGNVLHWGDRSFQLEAPVASYVQTDDGFVYTTGNETVWLFDGTTTERIGHARGNRLETDSGGSLVAWIDTTAAPAYVVYDTGTGREAARLSAPPEAEVHAVADGSVYWRSREGIVRYEVRTGSTQLLWTRPAVKDPSSKPPAVSGLVDVADGRLAYSIDGQPDWGLAVGTELDLDAAPLAQATNGALSPDGRFLAAEENDYLAVYDTTTRAKVTPDLDDYPYAVAYAWVDADTAMVFAIENLNSPQTYPADFLACDIPTGSCTVVGSDQVTQWTLVLPVGAPAR